MTSHVVGALILAWLLSWWMSAGDREIAWQRACYEANGGDWAKGDERLWEFIYEFASLPVLIVCVAAIAALVAGFRWARFRAWRRVAWFSLSLLLLGPGLIANLWLKETWGRPRPREVTEFGGLLPYEGIFDLDFTGVGKSFPCGHATMGFYFFGVYFLLRRRFPIWAALSLLFSLLWGGLIGYTRMLQGGHFPTDIVWAAAVMWISAALLSGIFGFEQKVLDAPGDFANRRRIPWPAKVGGTIAVAILLLAVALATPYRAVHDIAPLETEAGEADVKGSIRIELGETRIVPSDQFYLRGQAWGHGLPTSQLPSRWEEKNEADGIWRFKFFQDYSGFFTEIRQDLEIGMPWARVEFLKLDLGPGSTRLTLPAVGEMVKIELVMREGAEMIVMVPPNVEISFESIEGIDFSGAPVTTTTDPEGADYHFVPTSISGGRVVVERSDQ
ncbi:MAG: phosphatase PAP2 family protein [Verrucomicrobiae bacterium]|nr:phosphatase PAP2 family protein [Verrucomicrobiae bacterium]